MKTFALFLALAYVAAVSAHGHGSSYVKRHDEHKHHSEISVKDKHGHHHTDYIHHPAYKYEYGVEDKKTKDNHNQWEHRDGDKVHGEYTLHDADGTIRVVKYTSDKKSGFTAHVERIGHAVHEEGKKGGHSGGDGGHGHSSHGGSDHGHSSHGGSDHGHSSHGGSDHEHSSHGGSDHGHSSHGHSGGSSHADSGHGHGSSYVMRKDSFKHVTKISVPVHHGHH